MQLCCGRICNGVRGLKIHQSKSTCGQGRMHAHRSDEPSGEMEENPRQEAHHSPRDLSVPATHQDHTQLPMPIQKAHPRQRRKELSGPKRVVWKGSPRAWSIQEFSANLSKKHRRRRAASQLSGLTSQMYMGLFPHNIQGMITNYLRDIKLRFQSTRFTAKWQPAEKGIVPGCTISPILFIMGMNLIISVVSTKSRGPKTATGCQHPVIRAFMDDLTVITPNHVQASWVLAELDSMATWAKPKKSKSLVIQKGKKTGKFKLVQGEVIPNIQGNQIRCLGKWYDDSLSDKNSISSTGKQVEEWLKKIDKSGLPGKYKCWIFQHGLLPRLMWLLTVYEVLLPTVEEMERKFNKHLRR
ncbi:uncharacterized protein LOC122132692 [Tachysurus ichikawai]